MALIPPYFADCVVAIGVDQLNDDKRIWVASGFLYGDYVRDNEDGTKQYRIYLATKRHVFENLPKVYLRFNPISNEPAREYPLSLLDKKGAKL